jgi:alcohol dehydrogenase class IV
MWYFVSPQVVFGEGALEELEKLDGRKAFVVTDPFLAKTNLLPLIGGHLAKAGMKMDVFDGVEPEPSVQTIKAGAELARKSSPDWIVGMGGGSAMDAAKAIWVLYERPDLEPGDINPFIHIGLRKKARLVTVPTTSGTGAEVTWLLVLTDTEQKRKMGLGNRENVADIAIVDPEMAKGMPPKLTADTGMDALTHAVEGYTCNWHSDLTDGLCIKAARQVLEFLPRAVADGSDMEARERMHNAATCAGLGFGNSMASLAHATGHALGAIFHIPHGRAVSLFLPYAIEFAARTAPERYGELATLLGASNGTPEPEKAALSMAQQIRSLSQRIGNPISVSETGVKRQDYEMQMDKLMDDAFNDTQMVTAPRAPSYEELRRIFLNAYDGRSIDF